MTPTLHLDGVHKRYGDGPTAITAVGRVTLSVAPGELVAVMGPSGSGKSTLLHLAAGLEVPTAGGVWIDGERMPNRINHSAWATARRRRIGVIFQRRNLVAELTALENVMLPLELDGRPPRRAAVAAREALARCGIADCERRFPDDLSGGQQQRVAIARAVVDERALVLADEPTGALDTTTGDRVVELLAQRASEGKAVLLVTHDSRVASWADRVLFLRDGHLVDEARSDRPAMAVPAP